GVSRGTRYLFLYLLRFPGAPPVERGVRMKSAAVLDVIRRSRARPALTPQPSHQSQLLHPRRRPAVIAVAQPRRPHTHIGDIRPAFAVATVGPQGEIVGFPGVEFGA